MPSGPGTYGSKRGRPPMKMKPGGRAGASLTKKKAGGKVTKKKAGGVTYARGSGAARPQRFRKNG